MQHLPIKQSSGCPPISVNKWMIVGEPKMENNTANYGMNEIVWGFSIRKSTHDFETFIQFLSGWGFVEYRSLEIRDVNVFVWSSEAPRRVRGVQGVLRNFSVYLKDHLRRKRLVLQFYDAMHCRIVVDDHSFTPIARWAS